MARPRSRHRLVERCRRRRGRSTRFFLGVALCALLAVAFVATSSRFEAPAEAALEASGARGEHERAPAPCPALGPGSLDVLDAGACVRVGDDAPSG